MVPEYPIKLFSVQHLMFLAVTVPAAVIIGSFLAKKLGFNKKVIWVCAVIGLLCELQRIFFFIEGTAADGFRLPGHQLPFNACPFQVVLIVILALSQKPEEHRKLLSFMYPMMVFGGFLGMLLAGEALSRHGLSDFATYRFFFYHMMVISLGLYLYLSKPFKYSLRDYGMSLFLTFCSMIMGIWVNAFFGWEPRANHMFLVRPPADGLPILNLNHGWGAYIFGISCLGFILITLAYLPVIIRAIRGKLTVKTSEAHG